MQDALDQKDGSHIFKHWALCHPDLPEQPIFNFYVLKVYPTPLSRQIFETIKISTDGYLNAKCEFRQNQVKRLTTNLTARELRAEEAHAARLESEE